MNRIFPSPFLTKPQWAGIIGLQISAGLACIFVRWYVVLIWFLLFGMLILLFIKYRWFAYLIIFLLPNIGAKLPGLYISAPGFTYTDAIPFFLVIASIGVLPLLVHKSAKIHVDSMKNPLGVPILLLVSYSFITFFWSPAPWEFNLWYFVHLIFDVLLFYFLFTVIDGKDFHRRVMWCLIFSAILLSLQTIFIPHLIVINHQPKIFDWLVLDWKTQVLAGEQEIIIRRHGILVQTFETSLMLAISVVVAIGLLLSEKRKSIIIFLYFIIGMFLLALFMTKTKSSIWAIVPMLYLLLCLSLRLRKNFLRNALIINAALLLLFLSSMAVVREKKEPRVITVAAEEQGGSIDQRIYFWKTGFKNLKENSLTLFGLGVGGFKYTSNYEKIAHAHNLYLSLLFDFGIMGLIIAGYTAFILSKTFLKIIKRRETYLQTMSLSFGVGLFGIGLIGLVYIPYYFDFLWMFAALAVSTFCLAQKELLEENKI